MKRDESMDMLLMELLDYPEQDYRELYFELGSEWQIVNAKGWKFWGDVVWENWWSQEWDRLTLAFLERVVLDDDGKPYLTMPLGMEDLYDKSVIRGIYAHYMTEIMDSEANQAVMELSMHRAVKYHNQQKL